MNDIAIRHLCYGMTSAIPHTTDNVVFLDYDFTGLRRIIKICKSLQFDFELSTAYIAKTGETRNHIVFLDRVPETVWLQIIKASECHDGYRFCIDKQNYAVLRLIKKASSPAPVYYMSILSKHHKYSQSTVHGQLLVKFWNMPTTDLRLKNPDSNQLWESVYYFADLRPIP